MGQPVGSFPSVQGTVSVSGEALVLDRFPTGAIAGQLYRYRHGEQMDQLATVGRLLMWAGLLLVLALDTYWVLSEPGLRSVGISLVFVVCAIVPEVAWFRDGFIPREPVTAVELDERERTLTVEYQSDGHLAGLTGFLGIPRWANSSWEIGFGRHRSAELELLTDDAVRSARGTLNAAGIDYEVVDATTSAESETETEYRVRTVGGVVFCADCSGQVSPSDHTCPRCATRLRVERPA